MWSVTEICIYSDYHLISTSPFQLTPISVGLLYYWRGRNELDSPSSTAPREHCPPRQQNDPMQWENPTTGLQPTWQASRLQTITQESWSLWYDIQHVETNCSRN
jgi:hypothetical protein